MTHQPITILLKRFCVAACLLFILSGLTGCKKFVEADPPISMLLSNNVFGSDATAAATMTSVYSRLMEVSEGTMGGSRSISMLMGMAADELQNHKQDLPYTDFYSDNFAPTSNLFWPEMYRQIYVCNAVIAGLAGSQSAVTPALRSQLTGEAKFMRAFLYFYALNLYGSIPLATTTDYRVNNTLSKSAETDVYKLIVTDLKDAQSLLSDNWLTPGGQPTADRVRPNKLAATALLARVYLYLNDWTNAEAQANTAITTNTVKLESDLNRVFVRTSSEAIWQMQPVLGSRNTNDAGAFILTTAPGVSFAASISKPFLDAMDTTNDKRYKSWVNKITVLGTTYFYPFKYKVPGTPLNSEHLMVLRLSEQYLIRAEARAQQEKITGAAADLDSIRVRAGLPATTATTKDDLLGAIAAERRIELFTEFGHRWFDLKRTGALDTVMTAAAAAKGTTWKPTSKLLPIPVSEIILNTNLIQNDGY